MTSQPRLDQPDVADPQQRDRVVKALGSRSFATIASVSPAGFPHAAGVSYDSVGTTLYVHTMRSSRKARNIAANDRVAVVVPVRRLPVGPPFTVQFQARATLLDLDDPEIVGRVERGQLSTTSGHGALEEPDGCYVRIEPTGPVHTYGIGVSVIGVARDPLHVGARSIDLRECTA